MEDLLRQAEDQAETLLTALLGGPLPVSCRRSPRGTIATALPGAMGLEAQALARHLTLTGSCFERVTGNGAFLNFYLNDQWYRAVLAQRPEAAPFQGCPTPDLPSTVADPGDWRFLSALWRRPPKMEEVVRRDGSNPGWLARYTLRRLETLADRLPAQTALSEGERRLVYLAAEYPLWRTSPGLARYLCRLTRAVWELSPQTLSAPVAALAGRVLASSLAAFW